MVDYGGGGGRSDSGWPGEVVLAGRTGRVAQGRKALYPPPAVGTNLGFVCSQAGTKYSPPKLGMAHKIRKMSGLPLGTKHRICSISVAEMYFLLLYSKCTFLNK